MATHSSLLAWRSRGQRSLAGHSPWGHNRVGHALAAKQQSQAFLTRWKQCVLRVSMLLKGSCPLTWLSSASCLQSTACGRAA